MQHQQQQTKSNQIVLSIPIPKNLQQSIQMMSQSQIKINITQIHLLSMYNNNILKQAIQMMKQDQFYYPYRYLLKGLYLNQKSQAKLLIIKQIEHKFDAAFVNSSSNKQINSNTQIKQVIQIGKIKHSKAQVIKLRQDFSEQLNQLSLSLKDCKNMSPQQKLDFFKSQLTVINKDLSQYLNQNINDQGVHQQRNYVWKVPYKGKLQNIKQIKTQKSKYYQTKNRNPLLLDFGFGKLIYKNDDQLCNQIVAMNLIKYFNLIIHTGKIIQYDILPQKEGAFYEFVDDSMTIHQIKVKYNGEILPYIEQLQKKFNKQNQENNKKLNGNSQKNKIEKKPIRKNFVQTYAGFCFIQYVLQLKDRNNNNIMIRKDGAIFHIDLSFIFEAKPGGINFESAPFKLTDEYIQIMEGFDSDLFNYYETLLVQMFTNFYNYQDEFFYKMALLSSRKDQIKCFSGFNLDKYKKRFVKQLKKVRQFVQELIDESNDNWKTKKYDAYQFKTNGISQ